MRYVFFFLLFSGLSYKCVTSSYPDYGFALKKDKLNYFLKDFTNEWSGTQSQTLLVYKSNDIIYKKDLEIGALWIFDSIDENGNIILLRMKIGQPSKDYIANNKKILWKSEDGNILYKERFSSSTNIHFFDSSNYFDLNADKLQIKLTKTNKSISASLYNVRLLKNNAIEVYSFADSVVSTFSITLDSSHYSDLKKRIFF